MGIGLIRVFEQHVQHPCDAIWGADASERGNQDGCAVALVRRGCRRQLANERLLSGTGRIPRCFERLRRRFEMGWLIQQAHEMWNNMLPIVLRKISQSSDCSVALGWH